MRIAIAQMATRAGDFEETARRMVDYSRRAADAGVELLVFPAAALCGVSPVQRADREGFLLDLMECLLTLIDELACPCLLPMLVDTDEAPIPEALLVDAGEIRPVRLAARMEAMAAHTGAGPVDQALPEVPFQGARLGVAFTYDDLDVYDDYDYDVDVIVFLSGYGFAVDDPSSALGTSLTEGRFPADAEATGAWIVGVGSLGCYDAQVFCGSSFVLAPWGELAAQAHSFEEDLLVCDVDPSAEGPLPDPVTPEVYDAPLMTWGALTTGLASLVEATGGSGACVAVTGTLASAVLAVLAVDALGPTNVSAVIAAGDAGADASSLVRALRLAEKDVEVVDVGAADAAAARDLLEARLAALARRTGRVALGERDKTGRALEAAEVRVERGAHRALRRRLPLRPARARADPQRHLPGHPPGRSRALRRAGACRRRARPRVPRRRCSALWTSCSRVTSSGSSPSRTSSPSAATPRRSPRSWGACATSRRRAPRARSRRSSRPGRSRRRAPRWASPGATVRATSGSAWARAWRSSWARARRARPGPPRPAPRRTRRAVTASRARGRSAT